MKLIILLLTLLFLPLFAYASVIEIPGSSFPELLGEEIGKIRVYAADAQGNPVPVPFQIDQRLQGVWVLDNTGEGKLSPQDVVLLIDSDAGIRVDSGKMPAGKHRYEILLDAQESRAVYLAWQENPAPRSPKSYVNYDKASDEVATTHYQVGFSKSAPLIQEKLIFKNGSFEKDVLDRFKIRLKLAIKNFFDFNIHEGGITAQLLGVRTGPIRVIRRITASKKLGPIGLIPKSTVDFAFYPDWMEVPTRIKNPVDGPKFLEEKTQGLSGLDFSKNIYGSILYSNLNTAPVTLDGKSGPDEVGAMKGTLRWWSLTGLPGSMVVGVKNDPKLTQLNIHPVLFVADDGSLMDPPEGEAGRTMVGLELPYHRVPKGDYLLLVTMVFPENFTHNMEEKILQEAQAREPHQVIHVSANP